MRGRHSEAIQFAQDVYHADLNKALDAAFKFLGIDKKSFAKIHFTKSKEEFLLYRYLRAEYRFCKPEYAEHRDKLHAVAHDAYQLILNAPITKLSKNSYSKYSVGLTKLYIRTPRQKGLAKENLASIDESVISIRKKTSGVTPGFEAFHAEDVLLHLYKKCPHKEDRIRVICENNVDMEKLYIRFQDHVPTYLVKLAYDELENGRIVIKEEDLKRSDTIKRLFEKGELVGKAATTIVRITKAVTSTEANCEAVLENVANDVSRIVMQAQDQTIYPGRYKDGELQFALEGAWVKGLKTLGPLAGGKNNDNYRVQPVMLSRLGVLYISDNSINHHGEHLPPFTVQNDYDGVGSKGQNKGYKDNQLIAFDFGHAYQKATTLLDENKVDADFHIRSNDFKNYSIFDDSKRSDIVRGLIRLARLKGEEINDDVLRSYGQDFYAEVKRIPAHEDEKVFDDYIDAFSEMAQDVREGDEPAEIKKQNISCCRKIVKEVDNAKKKHMYARNQFVDKYRFYLSMESAAVDLLSNLEKLSTPANKISLRSPDGTVLLNHLRIDDAQRAEWQVTRGYQGQYNFSGVFVSERLAQQAEEAIRSLFPSERNEFAVLEREGKNLVFSFNKANLSTLANIFSEDKIKKKLVPSDYQLYEYYKNEKALIALLASLKAYQVETELKPFGEDQYALQFNKMDRMVQYFLKKELNTFDIDYLDKDKQINFAFKSESIGLLLEKLESFADRLQRFKQRQEVADDIMRGLKDHEIIGKNMMLILESKPNEYCLRLINMQPGSREADCIERIFKNYFKTFKAEGSEFFIKYEDIDLLNQTLSEALTECNEVLSILKPSVVSVIPNSVFLREASSFPDKSKLGMDGFGMKK